MDPEHFEQTPLPDSPRNKVYELIRLRLTQIIAALVVLALVVGVVSGIFIQRHNSPPPAPPVPPSPYVAEEVLPFRLEVSSDDDPAIGAADPQVVIVEFSDFSCPYCREFHLTVFGELMAAYPNEVQFVYRDFPVVGGGRVGFIAAQAANCAAEQGDYWAFHDALFSWDLSLNREGFRKYADELGLDKTALDECIDSQRYEEEVRGDFQDGVRLGVTSTPSFFINGIPLIGAQPFSNFARVIDAELAR